MIFLSLFKCVHTPFPLNPNALGQTNYLLLPLLLAVLSSPIHCVFYYQHFHCLFCVLGPLEVWHCQTSSQRWRPCLTHKYCPISLLSVPSKVIEACSYPAFTISSHRQPALSSSVWILPFPLNPNTKWYKALETKNYVGAVFLDISKVFFDTVSHKLPRCVLHCHFMVLIGYYCIIIVVIILLFICNKSPFCNCNIVNYIILYNV